MSFDTIYKWSKLTAVLCVVPITIYVCMFLHSLSNTSDQLAATTKALPTQIDDRIGKLQKDVLDKIDTVQGNLNTEVTTLATLADNRIDSFTTTTDNRLGSLEKDTFKAVGDIKDAANTQLTTANNSVTTLVTAYADIPKVVGARYEKDWASYFDCAANKLCLQGQASDTMFAVRQSSRDTSTMMIGFNETMPKIEDHVLKITTAFSTDFPKITGNINDMTLNIAGVSKNINSLTKPHWYDRIIGYALNGAIMYRSLNPVTSLTVAGAQVVSSQK